MPKQTAESVKVRVMISTMEDTKTGIKAKISFSVESLLSSPSKPPPPSSPVPDRLLDESSNYSESEENRLDTSSEKIDDEEDEDENITVDDEDTDGEGRESLSPNSQHTVIIPQPVHPSMPRIIPGHTQWPFTWVGPNGPFRSNSPQGKLFRMWELSGKEI